MSSNHSSTLNAVEVTVLLDRWKAGDSDAVEKLVPKLYRKLRHLAELRMANEPANHTLQPTALVNEAWLRLVAADKGFQDRSHFFAAAALAMRGVLVDHARRLRAQKRGAGGKRQGFDVVEVQGDDGSRVLDALALSEALDALHLVAPTPCTVATMKFLFGNSVAEMAEALGVSAAKIKKDWAFARAWLRQFLERDGRAAR